MKISRHGLAVEPPARWDARIYRRSDAVPPQGTAQGHATGRPATAPTSHAVLHAATFPLPAVRGDYGGGAVETMSPSDAFVALLEFHPDSARTPLFARPGLPRRLPPSAYRANGLQRTIPGQGGAQVFFHEQGRAFCLYVVLGGYANRGRVAPRVDALLEAVRIAPGQAS